MADVNRGNRPLSPHLQVYRPQITSMSSILNRVTGVALLLGGVLVVWWFLAAATGPEYFELANGIITSWIGDLVMLGSLWALWYHTLGGIRHLIWDTGHGFDITTAERMGWGLLIGSVALTFLTFIAI